MPSRKSRLARAVRGAVRADHGARGGHARLRQAHAREVTLGRARRGRRRGLRARRRVVRRTGGVPRFPRGVRLLRRHVAPPGGCARPRRPARRDDAARQLDPPGRGVGDVPGLLLVFRRRSQRRHHRVRVVRARRERALPVRAERQSAGLRVSVERVVAAPLGARHRARRREGRDGVDHGARARHARPVRRRGGALRVSVRGTSRATRRSARQTRGSSPSSSFSSSSAPPLRRTRRRRSAAPPCSPPRSSRALRVDLIARRRWLRSRRW